MVFGDRSCLTSSFPNGISNLGLAQSTLPSALFYLLQRLPSPSHRAELLLRAPTAENGIRARTIYGALGPRGERAKGDHRRLVIVVSTVLPSHHNCLGLTEIPPVSHKTWRIALSLVESTRICICGPRQHVCTSLAVPGTLETGHLMEDAAISNIVQ